MKNKLIIDKYGNKWHMNEYHVEGCRILPENLHREDGPAFENIEGGKEWRVYGKLHREDGAAVEWPGGQKSYYLEDNNYSEKDYWKEIERRKSLKYILYSFLTQSKSNATL
jgi:hypothetical protein